MSRPAPPKSTLERDATWFEYLFSALVLGYAGIWEAVWFALRWAGARPEGQLPSGFHRLNQVWLHHQHFAGGWVAMQWLPQHAAVLAGVMLILLGEALVAGAILKLWLVRRGWSQPATSPSRGGWGWRRPRRSGGGAGAKQARPASNVNTTMEEWLADEAAK